MAEHPSTPVSTPGAANGTPSVAAAERAVEAQREQLAETVDALQARLDVKARTQARLRDAQSRATTAQGKPRPELLAAAGAAVAAVVGLVWWRRR